jgi:hypothetical protein
MNTSTSVKEEAFQYSSRLPAVQLIIPDVNKLNGDRERIDCEDTIHGHGLMVSCIIPAMRMFEVLLNGVDKLHPSTSAKK